MNITFINAIRSYLNGDGAVILPEMELLLFGLGILLIDFWIEQKEKYWNAGWPWRALYSAPSHCGGSAEQLQPEVHF